MPEHDGVSEYRKVAQQRLDDARELLEPPSRQSRIGNPSLRHLRAAMYLAGYSVECILTCYIITRHPPARTLDEVDPALLTTAGHSLDLLLARTDLEAGLGELRRDWGICRTWRAEWRYDPGMPRRSDALRLVEAAASVHDWVRRRL
jgi:hypothetical protein